MKHLKDHELLLMKNKVIINGEESKNDEAYSLISQKPNQRIPIINLPFSLHVYNLAETNPDSTFQAWLKRKPKREQRLENLLSKKQIIALDTSKVKFNKWLQKVGSAPVIIDENKTQKSIKQIEKYFYNKGYFNVSGKYEINRDSSHNKRGSVTYYIDQKAPYTIDSIAENISSPIVDSLFQLKKRSSFVRAGDQYDVANFDNERSRITIQMRNSGLFYFDQDYVTFEADTNNVGQRVHVEYIIPDRRVNIGDSISTTEPFKIHNITDVRVITDYNFNNRNKKFSDSITFKGYELYGYEKLKYRPKAITDAISISPGSIFRDIDRTLTYNQISELRNFRYPTINYQEDPRDSTGTGLIATIILTPRKKYNLSIDLDAYTSTIQQFGIGFSSTFLIRNVFGGAENLEISGNGSVGSTKDNADPNSRFFNSSDLGFNLGLSFPSILFPVNTTKFIPKYMSPFTTISTGISSQRNIGLDRQSTNGIFSYRWKPSAIRSNQFDLVNLQYVRNLNPENYFNVYKSSYDLLNQLAEDVGYEFQNDNNELEIPDEVNEFYLEYLTNSDLNTSPETDELFLRILQRQNRLVSNNLIFATNFTWVRDSRQNIYDNSFSRISLKIELAGNLLSAISSLANFSKNSQEQSELFGVAFSQYAKFETNYIRHWTFDDGTIFALRTFGGIAIPYGNSTSIPFTRSYFAGGANDNRGWRAYDLGPGSSGGLLDFNEANFKLAFNGEYRFPILGSFKGAFFADAGNIWNIFDDFDIPEFEFEGLKDLKEIALATGVGLRYDFGFFVIRFDTGFKTYDPALPEGERWFKQYNFANAVYNIGINYPF